MIDVKSMFLKLTDKRYPRGKEDEVINLLPEFEFQKDSENNYYIIVKKPDGSFSDTMFTCHLDTVDRGPYSYSYTNYSNRRWDYETKEWVVIDKEKEKDENDKKKKDERGVVHEFDGDFIKTNGKTNLGADDKAGMVILLNMISENIPGLYYFFIGEESGCVGSSSLSRKFEDLVKDEKLPDVKKCISFDRRGYDSIITHQMSKRCASDTFSEELAKRLNEYGFWYRLDSGGIYTDSAEFGDIIAECSNISVGYFDEHTTNEKQDIEFLELLAIVCTKIDWETLPIERKPEDYVYTGKKSTTKYSTYYGDDWYGDDWYSYYNRSNSTTKKKDDEKKSSSKNNEKNDDNDTNSVVITTIKDEKLSKEIEDYDFDKWYNEQRGKIVMA